MSGMFTPEELAEMARADAEIEASFRWTNEELERSRAIDRDVVVGRMDNAERKKAAQRKAYREANRDKLAAYQKAIADARKARKWSQAEFAKRIGVSKQLVSLWELGKVPANWDLILTVMPEIKRAAHGDSSSEDGKG